MRLWSVEPLALDRMGLVAQWREALGAQTSLRAWYYGDTTVGYQNHPQLQRFKDCDDPLSALYHFLKITHHSSVARGYSFKIEKIIVPDELTRPSLTVTQGQLDYEIDRLYGKIEKRAPEELWRLEDAEANHLFEVVPGDVETWEKI